MQSKKLTKIQVCAKSYPQDHLFALCKCNKMSKQYKLTCDDILERHEKAIQAMKACPFKYYSVVRIEIPDEEPYYGLVTSIKDIMIHRGIFKRGDCGLKFRESSSSYPVHVPMKYWIKVPTPWTNIEDKFINY